MGNDTILSFSLEIIRQRNLLENLSGVRYVDYTRHDNKGRIINCTFLLKGHFRVQIIQKLNNQL